MRTDLQLERWWSLCFQRLKQSLLSVTTSLLSLLQQLHTSTQAHKSHTTYTSVIAIDIYYINQAYNIRHISNTDSDQLLTLCCLSSSILFARSSSSRRCCSALSSSSCLLRSSSAFLRASSSLCLSLSLTLL